MSDPRIHPIAGGGWLLYIRDRPPEHAEDEGFTGRTFASREDAVRESVAQTGVEPTEGIEVPW